MTSIRKIAADVLPLKYKDKIRQVVRPAQRLALGRLISKRAPDRGLLTVVIPVYNVAEYVADCLTSVVGQSYTNLEIIVVDDGSTDQSMRIVGEFAKWDKRISIIRLVHGGNGRARNMGIAAATGDYLTFADSDDIVAPGAYGLMMAAITKSSSDFVVGSSARLIGKKRHVTKLSSHMHALRRIGISIDDFPDILDDVFLWNKVFNKSFWDEKVAPIPEGVLYEDQETTARAFIRAGSFDVLEEVVYSWRQRRDGSSITQGKRSLKDLNDRMSVAHHVSSLVSDEASEAVLEKWYVRLLGSDLMPYYEQVSYTSEDYWSALHHGVRSLTRLAGQRLNSSEAIVTRIDPHARVLHCLAKSGMKNELEQVIVDRMETGTGFQVAVENGKFYAVPNYASTLPEYAGSKILECDPSLLELDAQLDVRGWSDSGELLLSGHGFLRGISDESTHLTVTASNPKTDTAWHMLETVGLEDEHLDARVNDPFASHTRSTFRAVVPAHLLAAPDSGMIAVKVSLDVAGQTFDRVHSVAVPGRSSSAARPNSAPHVVGFAANTNPDEFSVDISWGNRRPAEELYLATRQNRIDPAVTAELGSNVFRYVFRLENVAWGRVVHAPPSGAYTLRYRSRDDSNAPMGGMTITATEALQWRLPLDHRMTHANVQAWTTSQGSFAVTVGPPLNADERGKYWQRTLQQGFTTTNDALRGHAVFESFGGAYCTDSPRALSDQMYLSFPEIEICWSISDYSVSYPDYAIPLIRGSRQWFEKLYTAKYIFNNQNFPFYFQKKPGQKYVQSWHGTALKKIGKDVPVHTVSRSYRNTMQRESKFWDVLVVQNEFSARELPIALDFNGPVVNLGYPRNDTLASSVSAETRCKIRRILGVGDSDFLVLYAPTWRDTKFDRKRQFQPVDYLDPIELVRRAGPDCKVLLRSHHNVSNVYGSDLHRSVIDVSSYPEINDLMCATDVLVTDYSSIIFDYSVLGKPIIFLAPDLAEYRDDIRGFYLDYDEITKSKHCTTTEEVADLVSLLKRGIELDPRDDFQIASARHIRMKFADQDDGRAANRILTHLFQANFLEE